MSFLRKLRGDLRTGELLKGPLLGVLLRGGDPNLYPYAVSLYGFDGTDGATGADDESASGRGTSGFIGQGQIDTAQSKFGTASAYFDGNGDYLNVASSSDFVFDGDFTIDAWVRPTDFANSTMGIVSRYTASTGGRSWSLRYSGGNLQMLLSFDGSGASVVSGAYAMAAGEWTHVAATRKDGVVRVFANGQLVAQGTHPGTLYDNARSMTVGIYDNNSAVTSFKGHIDEVEILKGIARWDAPFTPPTAPYPRSA